MKKNDMVVVTIEDIGVNGEGIGKVDGYTLFIKDAVIGDKIEAKITKAKKKLRICKINESVRTFSQSCGSKMSSGKTVWRMPDSRTFI